jgi:hypothetical protein
MFSQKYFPYVRAVSDLQSRSAYSAGTTAFIVSVAVAAAVARSLPLPSSPVENAAQYFNDNHLLMVRERLASYNEAAVLKFAEAVDLAKKLWLQREWNASGRCLGVHHNLDFFDTISGVGTFFSPQEVAEIKKYSVDILQLACLCTELEAKNLAELMANLEASGGVAFGQDSAATPA